jgi:hypothetical protein
MNKLVIFCKSYRKDFFRLEKLAASISKFNSDKLPFYVSVPRNDINLFTNLSNKYEFILIADDSIIKSNYAINFLEYEKLPGYVQQQIVKSEFWRLGYCENYLCIDSDSIFIRKFITNDFINEEGVPYTTINENHQLLEDFIHFKKTKLLNSYWMEIDCVKNILNRPGRTYSFGPTPVVWSRFVWESLDRKFLSPNNKSILEVIKESPHELRWYGEALLKFNAIPLLPCESLFKVYHYQWQANRLRLTEQTIDSLSKFYLGVVNQSNWNFFDDWPNIEGAFFSKTVKKFKYFFNKFRY